ncbi:helix-turn-helix domain-containing protein [Acinetobacter baumannii]|uniref:helix-turn-helix domain-containing protein n=1 Tax=Acinetobacter baumannii TaxID=470 RepID=UPI00233FC3EC|nr:helix-turn-helix domain-containing protein [Acinetobacter baumannii]
MNNINERLRAEVDRVGVSRLSRDLGIARNTLYNWCEKGNIPLDKLLLLKDYGLDVDYVITGQKSAPPVGPEGLIVAHKFEQTTTEIKNKVLMLLLTGSDGTEKGIKNQDNTVQGQQLGDNNHQTNHHKTTQKSSVKVKKNDGNITGIKNG